MTASIPAPTIFDGQNTPAIYGIFHVETGKVYIGSTSGAKNRWCQHRNKLTTGTHNNKRLQNAWNKYGPDAFVFRVLECVPDLDSIEQREQHWLDKTQCYTRNGGYNIRNVAQSNRGLISSAETRAKVSAFHKGRKHSEEHNKKVGDAQRGLSRTPIYGVHSKVLTEQQVKVIFQRVAQGEMVPDLAAEIGVCSHTISSIIRRVNWSRVEIPDHVVKAAQCHVKLHRKRVHKLSSQDASKIKADLRNGMCGYATAKKYNVTYNTVRHIANGQTWAWVD